MFRVLNKSVTPYLAREQIVWTICKIFDICDQGIRESIERHSLGHNGSAAHFELCWFTYRRYIRILGPTLQQCYQLTYVEP